MILLQSTSLTLLKTLTRGALAGTALLGTVSCASLHSEIPRTNILAAHQQGWAVDPADGFKRLERSAYDDYIDAVFRDLGSYCRDRKPEPCKVLFFFHGGLNTRSTSVDRAARLHGTIRNSGSYPIFVNWNSSFPSTWWDHVARVRKGLWTGNRFVAFFPYFAAVDEVKSIVEAPVAWRAEWRHTFPKFGPDTPSVKAYFDLLQEQKGIVVNDISDGDVLADDRRVSEKFKSYATLPLTAPTKILAPPLLIQAAGPGAWDVMQRRTTMLFRTEEEFRGIPPEEIPLEEANSSRVPQTGAALAHFITRFQRDFVPVFCQEWTYPSTAGVPADGSGEQEPKVREEAATPVNCEDRLEITLVGHSMGTIIVDELLRYAPNMKVKNIVFMAAATPVKDYRDTVTAYMERNSKTQMFHLILHPLAEVSEKGFLDLSPRGSLLVWIDNYFTNPITPLDRTAGRFFNLMPELRYTGPGIRNRVHLKVFRVGESLRCWHPQKHGDFGLFPFWDPRFWDPLVPQDRAPAPYVRWNDPDCGDSL